MFRKKNRPTLDISQADAALQNIFEACNMEPNTIPFDKIVLRSRINTLLYSVCILIAGILLLLHVSLPFIFVFIHHSVNSPEAINQISIVDNYIEGDYIYLTFSSPLNAENSYFISSSGDTIKATSYDSLKKQIVFPYSEDEMNIYVESEYGSSATIIITLDN